MNPRRLQYLKAMDIDVWQRRGLASAQPSVPLQTTSQVTGSAAAAARSLLKLTIPQPEAPKGLSTPTSAEVENLPVASVRTLNWDELAACVRDCTACELHRTRTQTVFGVGNRQAEWMVIGEAPGADEDRQGEPFVGRAGQLLNSMLKASGFAREQVFIANVLKCRPPGNRDPKPEEAASCAGYLARQIELVNPRVILCVGRIAAQNLLNTDTPIGKLRGQVHRLGERPLVVTYHPAYLLRAPAEKRKAWQDLQLALQVYATTAARPA